MLMLSGCSQSKYINWGNTFECLRKETIPLKATLKSKKKRP